MPALLGRALDRLDARRKVTGREKYAGDLAVNDVLHAALVLSTTCSGRVRRLDTTRAEALAGVVGVLTPDSAPRLESVDFLTLLQDPIVHHGGQPVALVIATTVAQARRAASLLGVDYDERPELAAADFQRALNTAFEPADVFGERGSSVRGDPDRAFESADGARVDATYTTPMHVHSPIEPHVVIASWDGDRLTVQTAASGIFAIRAAIARAFALPPTHVHVVSPPVGGGFCSKNRAWLPCLLLAVSAAKTYRRPVRLELTREHMFTTVGNRQRTVQRLTMAADRAGLLVALRHDVTSETGPIRDYSETTAFPTRIVYACPNVAVHHRLVRTNTPQPLPMRGPGEAPGSFALECALDELAEKLRIDPVELRLRNWAAHDQHANRPWSSNSLRECLRVGADAFGWNGRGAVGAMRHGDRLVGWGMASSYYPGFRAAASARVRLHDDGRIVLECGNQETGTGACTIMAQAVAEQLGAPLECVDVRSGDTSLPETPSAAGAMSTASVIPAVEAAAKAVQEKIVTLATRDPRSTLYGRPINRVEWVSPTRLKALDGSAEEHIGSVLRRSGAPFVEADGQNRSIVTTHSVNTFGACYAEVHIDPDLGHIRVTRLTGAYAAGRIVNTKLARSQLVGGLVFGIGMALHEKIVIDPRSGLVVNRTLSDYLLPVHADVPAIDVHLVPEVDDHVPGGVKGLGMNGTVGTAAAIANAVYHATGIRVRDLPIRPEALLCGACGDC
jgi:xanthine dehydrogenase YagR molybdenum-binding subunit